VPVASDEKKRIREQKKNQGDGRIVSPGRKKKKKKKKPPPTKPKEFLSKGPGKKKPLLFGLPSFGSFHHSAIGGAIK